MFRTLSLFIGCNNQQLVEWLGKFLEFETRPDFKDEVPSDLEQLFLAIDGLDYTSSIQVGFESLIASWTDTSINLERLTPLIEVEGVELEAGFYIESYADASDTPEVDMEGYFFVMSNGAYRTLPKAKGVKTLPKNIVEPLLDASMF